MTDRLTSAWNRYVAAQANLLDAVVVAVADRLDSVAEAVEGFLADHLPPDEDVPREENSTCSFCSLPIARLVGNTSCTDWVSEATGSNCAASLSSYHASVEEPVDDPPVAKAIPLARGEQVATCRRCHREIRRFVGGVEGDATTWESLLGMTCLDRQPHDPEPDSPTAY